MFTYFTDRDGKYQLGTLKESAFDPLSRTCEFMLKEEAHHMMVGTTGIDRVVERTAQLMVENDTDEVGPLRRDPAERDPEVPELPLLGVARPVRRRDVHQRGQLLHRGLKGRWLEERRKDDHQLTDDSIMVDALIEPTAQSIGQTEVSALVGLNTDLRREYISDCQSGVTRWNRILDEAGPAAPAQAAARGVQPQVGAFAGIEASPDGELLTRPRSGSERKGRWLPTDVDKTHVRSLMQPVHERGKIAAWIAPPRNGINGQPFDYDYVHLA